MPSTPLKIAISGCQGRMGRLLAQELESGAWEGMVYAGGTGSGDDPAILFKADIVIDFSTPAACVRHAAFAATHKKPIVIGVTGLSPAEHSALEAAARDCPLLYAANTSIGVQVLAQLVRNAAASLGPDFSVHISETHHRHKKDAPSGTALMLGQSTKRDDIAYSSARGGDVIGDHVVSFFGEGEIVTLSHRATDRRLFARGALRAARWLAGKPAGLYSMRDVLGL